MKIILLQDVPGVGKKWEVKQEKGGYGRNYLLARNLAILATPNALKDAELKQKQEIQKRALHEDLFGKSLESLKDSVIVIERKANEKGHLFDGVDVKEIAGLLEEKLKGEISPDYIQLEKPIKEIGRHEITIQKGDSKASFMIEIKVKEN
ncbi:MAG: 50S ribosomal protein L9 [Candidatus Tagabacteria bacterium CG_4_10_14_0_2_um_filter_40_13]|uniref:Large ribosomal subunit protein bL9 n=2 Tax=Candidatus Tagaibacteriota TaxID=1817918 RepID=A0A2M7B9Q5_9BACT|nr:MAG: 50S ribosomal protein L9 [Candidatus Tagabacteria bacterium CG11_big_fil_rev_8_21_14_0_20_41_11]PIU99832.1 MAG: 50S ribosomal protein L9 [Candidatus Tagabacteria bacterium CG03_land_8_20_14_0_80_41_22]PIZ56046.1 MAG: 50S ribosomal protein L9 [Candidatus Tagabacteria bacterium CG_4_10_14_0_2_um_filter_40_13]PJC25225.1 MAG: 50S ribosomal protein L9 [Candidatus Tagabacteria bacterium CG_4_9_14_0_2_um_filter_41_11]